MLSKQTNAHRHIYIYIYIYIYCKKLSWERKQEEGKRVKKRINSIIWNKCVYIYIYRQRERERNEREREGERERLKDSLPSFFINRIFSCAYLFLFNLVFQIFFRSFSPNFFFFKSYFFLTLHFFGPLMMFSSFYKVIFSKKRHRKSYILVNILFPL